MKKVCLWTYQHGLSFFCFCLSFSIFSTSGIQFLLLFSGTFPFLILFSFAIFIFIFLMTVTTLYAFVFSYLRLYFLTLVICQAYIILTYTILSYVLISPDFNVLSIRQLSPFCIKICLAGNILSRIISLLCWDGEPPIVFLAED